MLTLRQSEFLSYGLGVNSLITIALAIISLFNDCLESLEKLFALFRLFVEANNIISLLLLLLLILSIPQLASSSTNFFSSISIVFYKFI